jgi:hypothetical protein
MSYCSCIFTAVKVKTYRRNNNCWRLLKTTVYHSLILFQNDLVHTPIDFCEQAIFESRTKMLTLLGGPRIPTIGIYFAVEALI